MDAARIPEWFPGVRSVEEISGPLDSPGTTYALRFNPLRRSRVEVTEVEAPWMHTRRWDARPFGTHGTATLLLRVRGGWDARRSRRQLRAAAGPAGAVARGLHVRAPPRRARHPARAAGVQRVRAGPPRLIGKDGCAPRRDGRAGETRVDGERDRSGRVRLRRAGARLPRPPGARAWHGTQHAPVLPLGPAPVRRRSSMPATRRPRTRRRPTCPTS